MARQSVLNMHMVYANTSGEVAYQQPGCVPIRARNDQRLLEPNLVLSEPAASWHAGCALSPSNSGPNGSPISGHRVASANKARLGQYCETLAPFAQPTYRLERDETLLAQ